MMTGRYRFGPEALPGGGVRFRLWAPAHALIELQIEGRSAAPMNRHPDGWHELIEMEADPGDRYSFILEDGARVPDPASRFQPQDVHGPSEVVGADFRWEVDWRGRPWEEAVLYELHVGTFTTEGTFRAAIERLDHLAGLGVTAVEIMPVADFPGARNWGYDGAYLFAPDATYGTPDDFRRFVDAAHARGIAVILDVVYNHFGPEGNYLPRLAPEFFTSRHRTPWGAAINYDGPGARTVREFVIENAIYWLEEFRLDGLRLDAVHAIVDDSAQHLLDELAARVRAAVNRPHIHLLLENEDNEPRFLTREPNAPAPSYTAQWNDDLHHALHVAATGESQAYYEEYLGNTELLARSVAEGFAFQGEIMRYRGTARGRPSAHLPPSSFVSFIQNHDQIGNRAMGDRLARLAGQAALRAVASIYLLAPQIPMLFMVEEWGTGQPFRFFCDFHGELAESVRRGRRQEFARFAEFADAAARETIPDPQSPATFMESKLDWNELALPEHAEWLHWYRRVLGVRRAVVMPLIAGIRRAATWQVIEPQAFFVSWRCGDGSRLRLSANLSQRAVEFPVDRARVFWHEGPRPDETNLSPWCLRWTLASPA